MALKEKALKRLAEKLKAAGVVWVLSGEYAMTLRGVQVPWHGFELLVAADAADAADKVLTRLGMRHEEEGSALRTVSYHFDGADILLKAGPVYADGSAADISSDAEATVLGVRIPLLNAAAQARLLTEAGQAQLAQAVSALKGD